MTNKYTYEPSYTGGFTVLNSTKKHDAAFIAQVPTELKAERVATCLNFCEGYETEKLKTALEVDHTLVRYTATRSAEEARHRGLEEMLHDLIVAANTAVGCYERNPANFASALKMLAETAEAARGHIS